MSDCHLNARAGDRPGIREILKCFPAPDQPENTLRWDSRLDQEQGHGIRVALLDSGVNWPDAVFSGAHLRGRDFTGQGGLFDASGHGSANAALLVGRHADGTTGLLPECELLVAKVMGSSDWKSTVASVSAALRWAIRSGCDVIILPFGTSRGSVAISREIRLALAQGCQIFAAAGNRGPEQICFPAWLPGVTAVSALGNNGQVLSQCCATDGVDLYCWGEEVPYSGQDQTLTLSGSSPATVLTAGVAALQWAAQKKAQVSGT